MKNIFFILLALLFSITSFAQTGKTAEKAINTIDKNSKGVGNALKDGTSTVYGDTKEVVSTLYNDGKDAIIHLEPKVLTLLDKVANKLETTSYKVWDILVDQQRVWSIAYLIGFLSALFAWYKFDKQYKKGEEELDETGSWTNNNSAYATFLFISASVLSVLSGFHLVPMLTGFFNPEYGAMTTIIELAQNLK